MDLAMKNINQRGLWLLERNRLLLISKYKDIVRLKHPTYQQQGRHFEIENWLKMKSLVNKLLEHQNDSGKSKILFRLSDIRKVKMNKFKIIFMLILVASGSFFDACAGQVMADSDLIHRRCNIVRVSTHRSRLVIQKTLIATNYLT